MKNKYGPIQVSTDAYLKILTEQELNRKILKCTAKKIIFAVAPENNSHTRPTHPDKYGLGLNGWSLCAK
jgi:hypothetical protein